MKWTIGATIALLLLVLGLAWGVPAVQGLHLGYNSATDNACETRLGLQWCGHRETAVEESAHATEEREAAAARQAQQREAAAARQAQQREAAELKIEGEQVRCGEEVREAQLEIKRHSNAVLLNPCQPRK